MAMDIELELRCDSEDAEAALLRVSKSIRSHTLSSAISSAIEVNICKNGRVDCHYDVAPWVVKCIKRLFWVDLQRRRLVAWLRSHVDSIHERSKLDRI